MKTRVQSGYVLLVVLAAVAVLTVMGAFVFSQTENQLLVTTALKGQSMASQRASKAAEAQLAQYKIAVDAAVLAIPPSPSLNAALLANQFVTYWSPTFESPADLAAGGGMQYCTQVWRLDRGPALTPWIVMEAYGYYGRSKDSSPGHTATTSCDPNGFPLNPALPPWLSPTIVRSHLTVQVEPPPPSTGAETGGLLGSGTVGGT